MVKNKKLEIPLALLLFLDSTAALLFQFLNLLTLQCDQGDGVWELCSVQNNSLLLLPPHGDLLPP